jgi:anthranilate synthase component 1
MPSTPTGRRRALPERFVHADPLLLARPADDAQPAALFQRFDLRTRRLARSFVPLTLQPLRLANLDGDLRQALPRSVDEAPLLIFSGVDALCGLDRRPEPAWLAYRLSHYLDIDAQRGQGWLVGAEDDAAAASLLEALDQRLASSSISIEAHGPGPAWRQDADERLHVQRVREVQAGLARRGLHGALLSLGMSRPTRADPFHVYAACVASNPSPYGYVLRDGDFALIGSSPLPFLQLQDGRIRLETDAGTRPVTRDAAVDDAAEADLKVNPKDAAEHQVVVEAELEALLPLTGRDAIRTVVSHEVRRFSHVMHLYSAFEAVLPPALDVVDAIHALAPAAAVSGHPKREAMALGVEIEGAGRGPYGGIVGLLTSSRDADLAVVIRSMWIQGGTAHLRVGGKVVPGSDPQAEYSEAISKSAFLVDALARAESRPSA